MKDPVVDYLERYAEPEARYADALDRKFGAVLVIPAFAEGNALLPTLDSIPSLADGPILVILVVNEPVGADSLVALSNRMTLEALAARYLQATAGPILKAAKLYDIPQGLLFVIQRCGEHGLPGGEGVGLARKIGCDLALMLFARGQIRSDVMHTTDADVILPRDYFDQTRDMGGVILHYRFRHLEEASAHGLFPALAYEVSLRYYVLGLKWAGSPYAFHTIGSCLAIRSRAYAVVRGFPRREAAEDFYLVSKCVKTGDFEQLMGDRILLSGRASFRVPFGTGRTVRRIQEECVSIHDFRLYHPDNFVVLRAVHQSIMTCIYAGLAFREALVLAFQDEPFEILSFDQVWQILQTTELEKVIHRCRQRAKRPPDQLRHVLTWFDAFRTLQLIHTLRDAGQRFASLPFYEALQQAPFLDGVRVGTSAPNDWDPQALNVALERLEL